MKEDVETQFETIDLFVRDILDDMRNISKSTTKIAILAHVDAWQNTLETIKKVIDI
tara:strand:+ start:1239 stop:1406 length:168 start_codon:yes stop_codon:yes gene_type:complete